MTAVAPLLSSAGAMVGGTLVGAGTGVLYWALAAHTASGDTLGQATTAVAVMTLVALVCGQPLAVTVLRRLPPLLAPAQVRLGGGPAGDAGAPSPGIPGPAPAAGPLAVVAAALVASACAAAVLAGLAAVAAATLPGLPALRHPATALLLVLATTTQAVGLVADAAAVAARRGRLVVARSAWHGTGKLVALAALSLTAAAPAGPAAVLGTWALAGLASAVFAIARLRAVLVPASGGAAPLGQPGSLPGRGVLAGAALLRAGGGAQLVGVLAASAPVQVLPILTAALAGASAAGVFSLSWMVAGLLFMASTSLCSATLSTAAADAAQLGTRVRQAAWLHLPVLVPGVTLLAFAAVPLLTLAGVQDVATGAPVLQVLALAAVPNAVANCLVAWLRGRDLLREVAVAACAGATTAISTAFALAPLWGPTGTAAGWALGQVVYAGTAGALVLRARGVTPRRAGTPPRPAARLGHLDALDGLRGLAVAAVVARHSAPSLVGGGGVVGVATFFTLSGFLITTLLLQEREQTGRVALAGFYLRRLARLGPALWALLAVYGIGAVLAGVDPRQVFETVAWGLSYGYNWAELAGRPLLADLGPLWSLAVEEQFYCLWPLVLVLAARGGERAVGLVAAAGLLTAAATRAALAGTWGAALYPLTFTWADALLAGALLAVLRRAWLRRGEAEAPRWLPRRAVSSVVAAAAVTCGVLALWPDLKDAVWLYQVGALALAGAAAVLVAVAAGLGTGVLPAAVRRLLQLRALVVLGRVSYGLYLWNLVVINVGDRLLADALPLAPRRLVELAVTAAVVTVSWRLVERPAQRAVRDRLARRDARARSASAPALAAVPEPPHAPAARPVSTTAASDSRTGPAEAAA